MPPPEAVHFLWKSDCLGCAVLLCLLVCMTLLASFFLLHLSLTCTQNCVILASTSNVSHYKHSYSLLHEVVVDESWHDSDGAGTRAFVKDLGNVLVLDTDHVLSVHLTEEVVNEEAIAGGRGRGREGESPSHLLHCKVSAANVHPCSEAKTTYFVVYYTCTSQTHTRACP